MLAPVTKSTCGCCIHSKKELMENPLSLCLSPSMSVFLSNSLSISVSVWLFVSVSLCLSPSVSSSICQSLLLWGEPVQTSVRYACGRTSPAPAAPSKLAGAAGAFQDGRNNYAMRNCLVERTGQRRGNPQHKPTHSLRFATSEKEATILALKLTRLHNVSLGFSRSLSVPVCLCMCPFVCLPVRRCLLACLPACPRVCLSICLSVCLSVCPSVSVCLCLFVCPSIRPFDRLRSSVQQCTHGSNVCELVIASEHQVYLARGFF